MKSFVWFIYLVGIIRGAEDTHKYSDSEHVILWMNTVGPYHNRQETYEYFSLPFCKGDEHEDKGKVRHHHNIGDALQGVELVHSGLDMKFKKDVSSQVYCSITLDQTKLNQLLYAVQHHYWYQMYIDDLPIWGIVGEIGQDEAVGDSFLWTHKKFEIGYNGDQIVDVSVTSESKVKLTDGIKVNFSYEVVWRESGILFHDRYDKYLDPSFFQHRIHWFSIFNSFMMVIFLVGLVSMILMRTLRKDYARYSKEEELDDLERDLGDEYGWKQIHGDVFRPAEQRMLFCSLIGTGAQICATVAVVVLLVIMGHLYTEHGEMVTTGLFTYAVLSPINGFVGGGLYSRMGGVTWIKQMITGAFLLPFLVSSTALIVNFVAISYHASRAIPFTTMLALIAIACFVIFPLTLVGTIIGKNVNGSPNFPCRVNAVPRPIPEKRWFMEPWVISVLGGILPFGSIFIEMYFILTSFWAYKIYYVYGFILLVLGILGTVTICVTIVCTYFLLNAEDYRWHWTSFLSAASTSGYVYLYSIYYFFFKTRMYGLFQTSFYFGYMAMFCLGLGLLCGGLGYLGTSFFVHKIYTYVKID